MPEERALIADRFRLLGPVGRGNMGEVHRAEELFVYLYGISREDADYIMDTFPIVRRKDEAEYGTYRTKDLILAEYDRMAEAGISLTNPLVDGENYTSTLTPLPGHGPRHPPRARSIAE